MRILVVYQHYYPEPFRINDTCETLVERGHEVTVLTGLPNYPEGRIFEEYRNRKRRVETIKGVNIIRCFLIERGNNRFQLFLNYISFLMSASLKAFCLKGEYDVIYAPQTSPILMSVPAIVYKKRYNKKMLLYCMDLWPASLAAGRVKEKSLIYKFFKPISKWIYESADLIFVSSKEFIVYFEKTLKIGNNNIKYLPQYSEEIFEQSMHQADNDKYNFVFAGNIGEMQSVETIIKAAHELIIHPHVAFHIVGAGSKLNACKKLSDDLKLNNVTFYGRRSVEEMPRFYNMASAMLVTLKDDIVISHTLPGKIQTYMAAGKPIIGSINGEGMRLIKESSCGICCAAEDYKGLAEVILKFCNSNDKKSMASNAKNYYLENFSKNKYINALENALKDLEG